VRAGKPGFREIAMTATFAPTDAPAMAQRDRSVWSRLFDTAIGARTRKVEQIVGYLDRHQYDLLPEVRIELERHLRR
jgi:hypothetical protein